MSPLRSPTAPVDPGADGVFVSIIPRRRPPRQAPVRKVCRAPAFRNVHDRLFTCDLHGTCTSVRFVPLATWGADTFFVFSFEVF